MTKVTAAAYHCIVRCNLHVPLMGMYVCHMLWQAVIVVYNKLEICCRFVPIADRSEVAGRAILCTVHNEWYIPEQMRDHP